MTHQYHSRVWDMNTTSLCPTAKTPPSSAPSPKIKINLDLPTTPMMSLSSKMHLHSRSSLTVFPSSTMALSSSSTDKQIPTIERPSGYPDTTQACRYTATLPPSTQQEMLLQMQVRMTTGVRIGPGRAS